MASGKTKSLDSRFIEMNSKIISDSCITQSDINYVRGIVHVTQISNELERIQDFINQLNTNNKYTVFDVLIDGSGIYRFSGYIYSTKDYGGGIWYSFFSRNGARWMRNNNVDTYVNPD